jgi:hypothetical protein
MIQILGLQKDGLEQPQFYLLTFRDPDLGAGHKQTIENGTEVHLRVVLAHHGIPQAEIDNLFANANH